ncbi:MAG: exodeoxyribonuclease V subunit alpha [Planctomycetes bacterium]|nr:exodeoxyribonuclease V subunit alpha [Planctomycetota bacterium]
MSTAADSNVIAELHADLLARLATGGDLDLLRRLCHALGDARVAGDVCVDLALWCSTAPSGGEPPRPTLEAARAALLATGVVATDDADAASTPLVIDSWHRLYTLRHYRAESRIAQFIQERLERPPLRTGAELRATLEALTLTPDPATTDPDMQLAAVIAGASRALTVLCGGPGTGKTTTVAKLMSALLHEQPDLRIAIAAPTGKAAARLGEALSAAAAERPELAGRLDDLEPQTLHRLLGYLPLDDTFRRGREYPLDYDLVVVDEVSMADPAIFATLCDAVSSATRLVLVGDKDQLAAVAAGRVLSDLTHAARPHLGMGPALASTVREASGMTVPVQPDAAPIADATVSLTKNHRFGQQPGIGAFALALVERDHNRAAAALRHGHDDLRLTCDGEAALDDFLPHCERLLRAASEGDAASALAQIQHARILTAQRFGPTGVSQWNRRVEAALAARGHRMDDPYYVGRPVLVTANDQDNSIWNGDLGVCGRQGEDPVIWIRDQQGLTREINPRRLPAHETAWAMTVHKAQGSEFDHVLLALPEQDGPLNNASLIYTGVTRARQRATICAEQGVVDAGLQSWPERRSGLARRLSPRDG